MRVYGMEKLTPQQRKEKIAFDSLKRSLPGLMYVKPLDTDGNSNAPDILAEFKSSKVAIEVTRVDRDKNSMKRIGFQKRLLETTQSMLRKQIASTEGICLQVNVCWNPHPTKIQKVQHHELADCLAGWVRRQVPSPLTDGFYLDDASDEGEILPDCLHKLISGITLAAYRVTNRPESGFEDDSHVDLCSDAGVLCKSCVSIREIEKAVEEKQKKITAYRKTFDGRIWLLLTCNFDDFRMPLDLLDSQLEITCDHGFDGLFLIDHLTDRMIEFLCPESEMHRIPSHK